jgi:hypothetical protein
VCGRGGGSIALVHTWVTALRAHTHTVSPNQYRFIGHGALSECEETLSSVPVMVPF